MLHTRTKPVEEFDDRLKRLLARMKKVVKGKEGVGLAAPQIGKSLQVFLVDGVLIRKAEEVENTSKFKKLKRLFRKKIHEVFINPEIRSISKDGLLLEEGCLSVPGVFGKVPRAKTVTVRAQDQKGRRFTIKARGLYAHVLQHEIDHLKGVLFIEKAQKGSLRALRKTHHDR